MPNCKSFLVTEAERKHVRRRARFQRHRDARFHQVFFFPARQSAEENSRHSDRNIRGICTIVCHHQNWVAQFKRGDFPTCVSPRPGRPKTMTTPEIMLTHMWQELEYRIDVCRVTRDAHIEHL